MLQLSLALYKCGREGGKFSGCGEVGVREGTAWRAFKLYLMKEGEKKYWTERHLRKEESEY